MTNRSSTDDLARARERLLARLLAKQGIHAPQAQAIPRRERTGPLPLSFAQQRLWFLSRLEPDSPAYNVPMTLRVTGDLDIETLERSINVIVQRHEALRTTFELHDGQPVQVIAATLHVPLPVVDLQALPREEQEADVRRLAAEEAQCPFDVASGPLIRTTLLRLGAHEHVLLLTLHHIVSDVWSLGVLFQELSACYTAFIDGQDPQIPALPIQYGDFAVWQRGWFEETAQQKQIAYWTQRLAHAPSLLELPTDRPRPPVQTFAGASRRFVVSSELTDRLKAMSRREDVTLFMTLLTALYVLLARYSNQTDLVVGAPTANRTRSELETLIGVFVNTLALRVDLSGNPPLQEALRRVREVCLGAYAHQDLPFEQVIEEVRPERSLSYNPLFQVMFVLQNAPMPAATFGGLSWSSIETDNSSARFDLTLVLMETGGGLRGSIDYNTDLFDATTMDRFATHFQSVLEQLVANPAQRLFDLPLLNETERRRLLNEWNSLCATYPLETPLHRLFEAQVERTPGAVALLFEQQRLTYRELNERANQVAHTLKTLGVRRGARVAICMDCSLEMLIGVFGILKAGAAYVPLDPHAPPERLGWLLDDSQAAVMVTQSALTDHGIPYTGRMLCMDRDWETVATQPKSNPDVYVTADDLAYVIYTSGSTGRPKGVMAPHRSVVNLALAFAEQHKIDSRHRLLMVPPLSFDASVGDIFPALLSGAALVLHPAPAEISGDELVRLSARYGITAVDTAAVLWQQWVDDLISKGIDARSTPLTLMMVGGDRVARDNVQQWAQLTAQRAVLFNHYGPTEATVCSTIYRTIDGREISHLSHLPIGRPLPNTQTYILDPFMQPTPIGVPGELYIGGIGVTWGYLNRPELTAERFTPDPFGATPGARLYRTGDLARYKPSGDIEFLGRVDHQIKIRGFRVELGEIEAILNRHPAVRETIVVMREDTPGDQRLVAYVVAATNGQHGEANAAAPTSLGADLRAFLREHLPDYMIPSAFVTLDALPLTTNGKVDRRALPPPDQTRPESVTPFAPPTTPVEITLAQIWADTLGVERVSIHDDFFDLGGHSLLALPLLNRIYNAFPVELSLRTLFESANIASLAKVIEGALQTGATPAGSATLDLRAEAILPDDIRPDATPTIPTAAPARVFLTGATGFLGAFLLAELLQQTEAEIYCLTRADSVEAGSARIRCNLERYALWNDSYALRIQPIPGDLTDPQLGLTDAQFDALANTIDGIYHSGGAVNLALPYTRLKAANVSGTLEILQLACRRRVKPVHFISTLAVFLASAYIHTTIREDDAPTQIEGIPSGYNQSKWVADTLVAQARERGLPVTIYRPARITGDSRGGVGNTDDALCRIIKGCIQLGCAPHLDDLLDMAPVDVVARAIVSLSLQPDAAGANFHFFNHQRLPFNDLIRWIQLFGYPLRHLPYEEWRTELIERAGADPNNALHSMTPLFSKNLSSNQEPHFDCQTTLHALERVSITFPPADATLMRTYFEYFIRSRFLEAPERSVEASG